MGVDMKVKAIYDSEIGNITRSEKSWKDVLKVAGQLYRYEFDNIVMVTAQRPPEKSTLMADYDTWKKVGRYVKRGAKGCAIFPSRALNPRMYNMGNVILQVTQNCNLRCEYCVYSGSYINRVHTNKRMSFETAVKTIDFLAAHSLNCNEVSIGFYGGEPLLEIELIKKAVSYAKEVFGEKKVNFNMTTNATLLNMDIADFLVQNDFNITISLDGPRNIHNKNRIFANSNKGTFDLIMENIALIREKYPFFDKKISFNAVIDLKQNVSCTNEFFLNYDTVKGLNVNGTFINPVNRKEILDFDPELNAISNYEVFKVFLYASVAFL